MLGDVRFDEVEASFGPELVACVHFLKREAREVLRVFLRVRAGGRSKEKLWGDTALMEMVNQTAKHQRNIGAKITSVLVHLIDHDVLEIREKGVPDPSVGKKAVVHHLRVGEQDVGRIGPNGFASLSVNIAVIPPRPDRLSPRVAQGPEYPLELVPLVVSQGLGRVDHEGVGIGFANQCLHHWDLEAQRLAAGGWRLQYNIVTVQVLPVRTT